MNYLNYCVFGQLVQAKSECKTATITWLTSTNGIQIIMWHPL